MLEPEDFGYYYAVGTKVHSRGEAIFFEVDPAALPEGEFPVHLIEEKCVPKADGSPKKSVYLGIYRVLSRIPVSALGKLYLVTRDGRTLGLERAEYLPEPERHENGQITYVSNERCFPYFSDYYGCSVCVKVCPFHQQSYMKIKDGYLENASR
jgi:hypothetical protein